MTKKSERHLPYLPDQGAPDYEYRDWLTNAINCPSSTSFGDFTRHGSDLADACTFTLRGHDGGNSTFKTTQNRLANPATVRSAIAYATHGAARPLHLSRPEYEDIWIAMVTLGNIVDTQTNIDEALSWLQQYERVCDHVYGLTFTPEKRFDALLILTRRPFWGKPQALDREDTPPGQRPVWVHDKETDEIYVRVSQLLAFLRHRVGAAPISSSSLTARMHEIEARRVFYESRSGDLHPHMTLFVLPSDLPES
jgi:hypothetical protein